jgi:hypothetical protein
MPLPLLWTAISAFVMIGIPNKRLVLRVHGIIFFVCFWLLVQIYFWIFDFLEASYIVFALQCFSVSLVNLLLDVVGALLVSYNFCYEL